MKGMYLCVWVGLIALAVAQPDPACSGDQTVQSITGFCNNLKIRLTVHGFLT